MLTKTRTEVMLQASLLEEICKEMEGIGEQLEVSVDHDRLQFNGKNNGNEMPLTNVFVCWEK